MSEEQVFQATRKVFALYAAFFKAVAAEIGMEKALALHAQAHAEQGIVSARLVKARLGNVPCDISQLASILLESNGSIGINSKLEQASSGSACFENSRCPMYDGYRMGGLDDETAEALCQTGAPAKLGTMLHEIDPRICYHLKSYRKKPDEACEEEIAYGA